MRTPYIKILLNACLFCCFSAVTAQQDVASLIKKGDAFFDAKKYDSAIALYNKAIVVDAQSYEAWFSRGLAWYNKRQYNAAIADFTQAINTLPADSTEFRASLFSKRGGIYETKKSFDSAWLDYTAALSIKPDDEDALYLRGMLQYNRNAYESSLKDLSAALLLDSANANLYRQRSKAWYCLNEMDSALKDINHIIYTDTNVVNYNYRGLFYHGKGMYDSAANDFMMYMKNNFSFGGNSFINIIAPLVRMKRFQEASVFYNLYKDRQYLTKNLRQATGNFNSFLDQDTYRFYSYYVEAADLVSDNKLQEALLKLDTASKKYGTEIKNLTKRCYVDILALRGYILEKLGKNEDAKACYEQALVIDSRQPDVKKALENMELMRAMAITRRIDKVGPTIKVFFADTARTAVQNTVTDSITIKIIGTASDESGIKQLKVDSLVVTSIEEDGFFRFPLRKKKDDTNPIVITATDSSGNSSDTILKEKIMRGGEVTSLQRSAPTFGKYYAILVAEKDYADSNIKSLNYPVRDARNLKKILTDRYTFEPEDIDTLYNRSREDILEAIIARCKAMGTDDNLLIFYAGHGDTTHDVNDHVDGYLIPTSAKKGMTSYFITSEEIKKALLRSNARHVLILLDACYSGAFTRGNDDEVPGDIVSQWKSPSRKVMTSGNLEAVPDESFFIRYLADFLKENTNPFVTAKDVWNYVDRNMKNAVSEAGKGNYYNPQYSAITGVDDKGGSFIFVLRPQKSAN